MLPFYGADSEEESMQEGLIENLVDSQSCINWFPSRSLLEEKNMKVTDMIKIMGLDVKN